MVQKVYVLIGIPGCGKSTFTKKLIYENMNTIALSADDIRKEMNITDWSSESNEIVFTEFRRRLRENLYMMKNVVIDNTNVKYQHRKSLYEVLNEVSENTHSVFNMIHVYFDIPLWLCQFRNIKRKFLGGRYVNPAIIAQMQQSLELPNTEEREIFEYYEFITKKFLEY